MEISDAVVVAVIVGFVAACVVYVRWCDRMLGPDPAGVDADGPSGARRAVADEVA